MEGEGIAILTHQSERAKGRRSKGPVRRKPRKLNRNAEYGVIADGWLAGRYWL